jgi:hypothetical protein
MDTLTALIAIGKSLGVDTDSPFKHDEVWKTVTAGNGLHIRYQPFESSSIVGVLLFGAYVRVLESLNGWARIGTNQWVSEAYLK